MIAIECKYHGPTDTRGSRITASTCNGQRVTISYPYELSGDEVYKAAADALVKKLGWGFEGKLVGGHVKDGMVFVFAFDN